MHSGVATTDNYLKRNKQLPLSWLHMKLIELNYRYYIHSVFTIKMAMFNLEKMSDLIQKSGHFI